MPLIDEAGRRLQLSPLHVHGLAAAFRGTEPDAAVRTAQEQLQEAGLLDDQLRLHPLAADLARCAALPLLRLVVEVAGPQGESLCDVVVSGEDVWVSQPWPGAGPQDEGPYVRRELTTLLWDLARLVGLHRSSPSADAVPLVGDLASFDAVLVTLMSAPGQWADAKAVLLASDALDRLEPAVRARWGTLLHSLRASWRITCFWGDETVAPDSVGVKTLAVLDAGPEGLWQRTAPPEPLSAEDLTPTTPVRFEPVSGGQLWRALADLLPTGEQLRSAADKVAAGVRVGTVG